MFADVLDCKRGFQEFLKNTRLPFSKGVTSSFSSRKLMYLQLSIFFKMYEEKVSLDGLARKKLFL